MHSKPLSSYQLGILTGEVCDYYRFQRKPNLLAAEEFDRLPTVDYDNEDTHAGFGVCAQTCIYCLFSKILWVIFDTRVSHVR